MPKRGEARLDGFLFWDYRKTSSGNMTARYLSPAAYERKLAKLRQFAADYQRRAYADPVKGPKRRADAKEKMARMRIEEPARVMLTAAKARAKRSGLPFTITAADITIPTHCPALGIELATGRGRTEPSSPSLDRIHPALGYVPGNVVVVSHVVNRLKGQLTPEQLQKIANFYTEIST